ncbi:hypothetical protein TTHERM_00261860 (macronuclear) [Tetrahymena thermophila SB210]|uniref:Uncharacterized protein n=1 Tax=Tetrahymena thermophila (strain SB210) TaxID=312017 RepID=Q22U98_TETTS|nr:hypothetical protein TTHERM_00261860 [Tetrahymena thermophila SB210]EAR88789.2 hypothetical protein TTHERM_00261860 [Tetrahymena thermophila SB210]|eukprot:XP_001009034.2 hypothetical protein TTHERM_00261860 [Tetrahymena thermophila SB210]
MKNIPRKDKDKKLLPYGILNNKTSLPAFSLIKKEATGSPERFNENLGFFIPKKNKRKNLAKTTDELPIDSGQKTPLLNSHQKQESEGQQNKGPDTKTLLARMNYGGMQGQLNGQYSTSLLASQREASKKQINQQQKLESLFNGQKSTLAVSSSTPNNLFNGNFEQQIFEHGDFFYQSSQAGMISKEQILQKFLNRSYQNTRKRIDLMNSTDKFPVEVKKKLEHWNSISNLLDNDIEEKLHLYSDLWSIAEKYTELNQYLTNIIKSIYNIYLQSIQQGDTWKEKLAFYEERVQQITTQKDQVTEMLKEKNNILKKFIDMGNMDEYKSKKEKRENYLTFENTKLAAENHMLAEKLRILETGSDIFLLKEQLTKLTQETEAKVLKIQKEADFKDRELQKRKLQITQMQGTLSKIEVEVRQLRTKMEETEIESKELKEQNKELVQKFNKYRELALMTHEDYQGMILKTNEQRVLLNTLREKSQALKAKLDRFTIARSKEVEVPNDGSFPNDLNMLKLIQSDFSKDKTYFKLLLQQAQNVQNREFNSDPVKQKFLETLTQFAEKGEAADLQSKKEVEVPIASLQVYKPNYYIFVEQVAKNYELDMQNMKSRKISTAFIGNLRAILDSKYNEILMFENTPKQISKFPDFVYSWLGKFTVDQNSRQIRLLQESEKIQVDDSRVIFLLDLTNPKFVGIWEIVTFKEFFSEKASIDEIYFYLHCRNMLFKGPCMQRHESTFDIYQYVFMEQAEQLIDLMMIRFDPVNVMLIKKQLKEKVKVKKEKNLVESGFILRILLEFYRIEKKNRYKLLREAFLAQSSMGSSGKFCINFPSFKKILLLNFSESTEQELAEIYREAYSLGQGSVTVDLFYTVANESCFFLKYLQLNSYVKVPQLDSQNNILDDDQNICYRYFYNVFDTIKQYQDILTHEALQLGIDRIYNEMEEINYQIAHKFQQDVLDLRGKPFFLQLQRMMTLWYQIKTFKVFNTYMLPPQYNYGFDVNTMVLKDFDNMQRLLSDLDSYIYHKKIEQLEKNNKLRKVQKLCRQKISKFYSFVSSLLSAKLKASVKDKEKNNRRKSSIKQLEPPVDPSQSKKLIPSKQKLA